MPADNLPTADLVDAHEDRVRSCAVQFRNFGGRARFFGPVRTVKTFEDNALIKATLASPGEGAVLVVDGHGSLRRALVGDLIGASAVQNGWAGLVIFGVIRDSVALAGLNLGVKALGTNPCKSTKQGSGALDVAVSFGGIQFKPGEWLYSDEDGILVSEQRL